MNDIDAWDVSAFYTELEQQRASVTQFLNSYGIEKGGDTYLGVTKLDENSRHELLRHRLNATYGAQKEELPPFLAGVAARMGITGNQLLGAIMYLEIDDRLQKFLTRNITGKNNIAEHNCLAVAVFLAEMEMCAIAIGLQGMRNSWQSVIGGKKKGTEGYLKHALRKICQSIGSTSLAEFKVAIKDRGLINDLYEAAEDQIGIHDIKLQEDRLLFNSRMKGDENRKISTIKNILSEINL